VKCLVLVSGSSPEEGITLGVEWVFLSADEGFVRDPHGGDAQDASSREALLKRVSGGSRDTGE